MPMTMGIGTGTKNSIIPLVRPFGPVVPVSGGKAYYPGKISSHKRLIRADDVCEAKEKQAAGAADETGSSGITSYRCPLSTTGATWSSVRGTFITESGNRTKVDVKNNLRTLTILVIEDDPGSRSALRSLLEACQYNVIEAEDGEEGWLRISRDHPDLVLMDIMMPVVDGLTLTRKLRSLEEFREIPIIAVTAMEGVRQLAMDAGCDAYLAKPFEITGLLTTISELLAVSTRSRR